MSRSFEHFMLRTKKFSLIEVKSSIPLLTKSTGENISNLRDFRISGSIYLNSSRSLSVRENLTHKGKKEVWSDIVGVVLIMFYSWTG